MKVLYIGHYREGNAWSYSAINHILSLECAGVDVVCRNVALSNTMAEVPDLILELEKKQIAEVDYCIQNLLPNHLVGSKKFKKNVAFFPFETVINKNYVFMNYFDLVDELWVPNISSNKMLQEINIKSKVLPPPFNKNLISKDIKTLNLGNAQAKFKFYTVVSDWQKQNVDGILRSYFSEFKLEDQVCLIIVVNGDGISPQERSSKYSEKIQQIKNQLRIHKRSEYYPQVLLITQDFDSNMINSFHVSCDCYIDISHSTIWDSSTYTPFFCGNKQICSNNGIAEDILAEEETVSLIDGVFSVCTQQESAFPAIFTGKEKWFMPSEAEVAKSMRKFSEQRYSKKVEGKTKEEISLSTIGNKIKEFLNE